MKLFQQNPRPDRYLNQQCLNAEIIRLLSRYNDASYFNELKLFSSNILNV